MLTGICSAVESLVLHGKTGTRICHLCQGQDQQPPHQHRCWGCAPKLCCHGNQNDAALWKMSKSRGSRWVQVIVEMHSGRVLSWVSELDWWLSTNFNWVKTMETNNSDERRESTSKDGTPEDLRASSCCQRLETTSVRVWMWTVCSR